MIMQKVLLAILLLIFTQNAYSQVLPTIQPTNSTDSGAQKKAKPKAAKSVQAEYSTQTIKFTTDEDCDILIDGDNKGHLKLNSMLKIKLNKGQYLLRVKGANAADQINETLTVDETGSERLYPISLKAVTDARVAGEETIKQTELLKRTVLEKRANLPKMDMVLVEGGSFDMGNNNGDNNERPVHHVTVSSFYISKYLVTQAQWQAVMGDNPSSNKCDNCPVDNITWDEAQAYCQKKSELIGLTCRLPTEAEWEYAARGGNKSNAFIYSGSNNIADVAWYDGNAGGSTHPVGQKQPNELGLYDMTGEAWEWCRDWYDESYYRYSPSQNPQGASEGSLRIIRGGSWRSSPQGCRAVGRNYDLPDYRSSGISLRIVVD
jgi:formylglycine-generating enzyme required for sulfatase activity